MIGWEWIYWKIVQEETHNKLINIEGKYKGMYEAQTKYYQKSSVLWKVVS